MQAALAATYIMGYRLAMIVAGAGSLVIAAFFNLMISTDLRHGKQHIALWLDS